MQDGIFFNCKSPKLTYTANLENIKGKNVLLVDDIIGEGSTWILEKIKFPSLAPTLQAL
ncbi:MAG: phosphoribosyltransferase [Desulfobacteraceae bacterium]|nr:phosphoribosyltransferase [Desulfobacteraceae bacterium]